jgi:antitoxin MazE
MDILCISIGGIILFTKIQKWGNSQGIRLPKQVLEDVHLSIGDDVEITARDGIIVIAPAKRLRGKYDLHELISRIPRDYRTGEYDWGKPAGREVW